MDKDWEARFKPSNRRPLPSWAPWLIADFIPIPGPWWVQILAWIGIVVALSGLKSDQSAGKAGR